MLLTQTPLQVAGDAWTCSRSGEAEAARSTPGESLGSRMSLTPLLKRDTIRDERKTRPGGRTTDAGNQRTYQERTAPTMTGTTSLTSTVKRYARRTVWTWRSG